MIGAVRDPVFGPAISFGLGGTMVEVIRDRAVALPPVPASTPLTKMRMLLPFPTAATWNQAPTTGASQVTPKR